MRAVPTPMPVSVTMNVYFRPTLSPSQPKRNAPSGRIRKPTEKIATVQEGRDWVALLEELGREDRGQAAEDVEIVPLDDVADGCGNDDAAKFFARNVNC